MEERARPKGLTARQLSLLLLLLLLLLLAFCGR